MFDKKGQIRMLEAFLAVLVIFSASILSITFSPTANFENRKLLAALGMQTLMKLDNDGALGELIDDRNWTAISKSLEVLLPVGVSYNVTIYDEEMRQINNATLSNGLMGRDIVSVEYPCVSQSLECCFYLVRLELAFAG